MIHIVGHGQVIQARAFEHVKRVLHGKFDRDIYLGGFLAAPLGLDLRGQAVYQMENLHDNNPTFEYGYFETLKKSIVIDFSRSNVEWLASKGIDAFYMPFGFDESLKTVPHKSEKDIDVLFIGSMHFPRRHKVINELSKWCRVEVTNHVYGKELDEVASRARVHINMHHAEIQPLETVRLNYLLANGCTVVSERGSDKLLNSDYERMVIFSDYENLVDSVLMALINGPKEYYVPEELNQDCTGANEWLKYRKYQLR